MKPEIETRPPESPLEAMEEACGRLLETDSVSFRLVEGDDLVVAAKRGDTEETMVAPRLKVGEDLSGIVATSGEPLIVTDLANDPRAVPAHREIARQLGYQAFLGVPVKVGDRVVGVLSIRTKRGQGFSAADVAVATAFASQAAIALENSRLYEEVRAARDFLRSIAENSADAIVTTDVQGRITYFSPGGEELLGFRAEEVLGQPVANFYPSGLEEARAVFRRLRAEGRIRHYETAVLTRDGRQLAVRASFSLLRDARGTLIGTLGVITDVGEQRKAEEEIRRLKEALERRMIERTFELEATNTLLEASGEQLRALSAHLQIVREEERARIAREIHDELGQELMALKMELSRLTRQPREGQEPLWEGARLMSEQVDRIIGAVREISTKLRPAVLDDLGLVAALEWQAQDFQRRTGITCRLTSEPSDIDLDRDRATAVFRIFQEALTNVASHAGAKAVGIGLRKRSGDLILEVRDDGRELPDSAASSPKSLGLLGMRQRAAHFGGQVTIRGIRGKGTTVTVRLPLRSGTAT